MLTIRVWALGDYLIAETTFTLEQSESKIEIATYCSFSKTFKCHSLLRHAIQYRKKKEVTKMDRNYTIPCQKTSFSSCEGCPEADCNTKHYLGLEPQLIHA